MKRSLIVGVFFLAATLTGMSQDRENKNKERGRAYQNRYERLSERLSLSEQQLADIKKIDEDHSAQMKEFREKVKEERQKMFAERQKMSSERDEQIKKLLTEEQYQKLNEPQINKQQRYNKGKKHYRGGKRPHRRG